MNRARGFTLIEVLVAVLVVALGVGALLSTLSSSADAVARLRDKSFAQWIGLNQISTVRLSGQRPTAGTTSGEVEYAGRQWQWQQLVAETDVSGILRVEVRVAPKGASIEVDGDAEVAMQATGVVYAFLGSAVTRASGIDPDWSLASAASRAGPGPGGGPAPGGGGEQTGGEGNEPPGPQGSDP